MRRADYLQASPPLFRWAFLDRMTRLKPKTLAIFWVPVIAAFLVCSWSRQTVVSLALFFTAGWACWTLTEYLLHRWVFHLIPHGRLGERMHWLMHGVHHEHPQDPSRIVTPLLQSIPIATVLFCLARITLGDDRCFGFLAGFTTGYLVFDLVHAWLHTGHVTGKVGKALRDRHLRHHFEDDSKGFGVSNPFWDKVFGTSARARR